jgi:hypothetical protein
MLEIDTEMHVILYVKWSLKLIQMKIDVAEQFFIKLHIIRFHEIYIFCTMLCIMYYRYT